LEFEAKVDAKRLALEVGVHEDEPELFFRGGKEEWQWFLRELWLRTRRSEILFDMKQFYY